MKMLTKVERIRIRIRTRIKIRIRIRIMITSFSMKVLLDTELSPRKKYGVVAVESFMSPANLR